MPRLIGSRNCWESRSFWKKIAIRNLNDFGYILKKEEVIHHEDRDPNWPNIGNLIVFKNGHQHYLWYKNEGYGGYMRLLKAIDENLFNKFLKKLKALKKKEEDLDQENEKELNEEDNY